jgi:hypothetical protein
VKQIVDLFQQRYQKLTNFLSRARNHPEALGMNLTLVNFNTYLNEVGVGSPQVLRWVLLNQTYKELHPRHTDLIDRSKDDMIFSQLMQRLGAKDCLITSDQYKIIKDYKYRFMVLQQLCNAQLFICKSFQDIADSLITKKDIGVNKWMDTVRVINAQLKLYAQSG